MLHSVGVAEESGGRDVMSAVKILRGLAIALLLSGVPLLFSADPTSPSRATEAERAEIRDAAAHVMHAILQVNVPQFLRYVSRAGLTCTDIEYSFKAIKAFLADKKSHLFISLFDTGAFARRRGEEYPIEFPAISEREFLRSANQEIEIGTVDAGWVQVTISSPVENHYKRE